MLSIGLIFLGSLSLQFLLMPSQLVGPDTVTYLRIADGLTEPANWLDPNAFDGNYWPIGYPTFIALVWTFNGGSNILLLQLLQVVLAASFVALISPFTYRFSYTFRVATALCVGVSPSVIALGQTGGYELILGILLILSLAILWYPIRESKNLSSLLKSFLIFTAGLSFGLAFHVQNKVLVVFVVFLYLAWFWGGKKFSLFLVGSLIPPVCWAIRNFVVLGNANPLSTNGPINVWIGNNAQSIAGGFMEPLPLSKGVGSFAQGAIDFWVNQPEASITLIFRKIARLLEPTYLYPFSEQPFPGSSTLIHYSTAIYASFFVFLFIASVFAIIWRADSEVLALTPLIALYLLFLFVNIPFLAESRYRTPLEPLLICIALITGRSLVIRYSKSRESPKLSDSGNNS